MIRMDSRFDRKGLLVPVAGEWMDSGGVSVRFTDQGIQWNGEVSVM